jgi:hypothetical protein
VADVPNGLSLTPPRETKKKKNVLITKQEEEIKNKKAAKHIETYEFKNM